MDPQIRLLGRVQVFDGRQWHDPPSHLTVALLCYLAVQPGWCEREHLAALFWPETDQRRALTNLRSLVARSKRHAFAEGLSIERSRLRWPIACDVQAFLRAVSTRDWATAVATYGGELLAGASFTDAGDFGAWLQIEREGLRERHRTAAIQRVQDLRAEQRWAEALTEIRALIALDRLNEDAVRICMQLHADAGRQAQALCVYRDFRDRLEGDLGLRPTSVTEALASTIRTGTSQISRRADLVSDALLSTTPATRLEPPAASRSTLPSMLTSFVGRESEIAKVVARLTDPHTRLLTVTGTGGVGKTRLALRVATEIESRYPGGVHFVALEGLSAPSEIPVAIAKLLGFGLDERVDPVTQLSRAIGSRDVLLILDNVEHLVAGAPMISRLLSECPGLDALVTSRERLGIAEEWLFPLGGMAYPATDVPLERAESFDAVSCLVERIRQVRPEFMLDDASLEGVAGICRLVEGLPLGLELAAVWARVMPVGDIATEIERNLDFLDDGTHSKHGRHESIRAAFEHSWTLLTPVEQEVLANLAVFRGGFRRDAAAFVAGASIAILASLTDKSLLRVSLDGRYDRHPLVHAYTAEKLAADADRHQDMQSRHAAFFVWLLDEANPHLGTVDHGEWQPRLESERENLAIALDRSIQSERAGVGLSLASAMRWLSWPSGNVIQRRAMLERLLSMAPESRSPARVRALHMAGVLAHWESDFGAARAHYEEGLSIADSSATPGVVTRLLNNLAHIARVQGDLDEALVLLERCLEARERTPDETGIANAINNLGTILRLGGSFPEAHARHEQALAIGRNLDDALTLCQSLNGLGYVARDRGELLAATDLVGESLAIARGEQLWAAQIASLHELGSLAVMAGDADLARRYHAEGMALQQASHMLRLLDKSLETVAQFFVATGQPLDAANLWGAAEVFRTARNLHQLPNERASRDESQQAAQKAVGERAIESGLAAGRKMDAARAISFALARLQGAHPYQR